MSIFVSDRMRLAIAAIALAMAGCGASSSAGTAAPLAAVTATDADNGGTVTVAQGGRLTVTLNSTYWTIAGASNAAVLREVGQPVAVQGSCPPGVGCGHVTATFAAVGRGRADVTATRASCGEALSCTGGSGRYRVSVVVG